MFHNSTVLRHLQFTDVWKISPKIYILNLCKQNLLLLLPITGGERKVQRDNVHIDQNAIMEIRQLKKTVAGPYTCNLKTHRMLKNMLLKGMPTSELIISGNAS